MYVSGECVECVSGVYVSGECVDVSVECLCE